MKLGVYAVSHRIIQFVYTRSVMADKDGSTHIEIHYVMKALKAFIAWATINVRLSAGSLKSNSKFSSMLTLKNVEWSIKAPQLWQISFIFRQGWTMIEMIDSGQPYIKF